MDNFKLDLIKKINARFQQEAEREKREKQFKREKDLIIERERFSDKLSEADDEMIFNNEAFESIAACENKKHKKRSRVNSGSIFKNEDSHSSIKSGTTVPEDLDLDKVFVLKRDGQSHQSKGYFFLAVVFGLMCGSSYNE